MARNPNASAKSRITFLRQASFFSELPGKFLRQLESKLKTVIYETGQTVFQENDPGDAMYLIAEGIVEIEKSGMPLLTRGPGEVVGEFALLDNASRSGSVTAKTKAVLWKLERSDFQKFFLDQGRDSRGIMKTLTQKLRESVNFQVEAIRNRESSRKQIQKLENQRDALADALNRLPLGVILLDRSESILMVNKSARFILNQQDGLLLTDRGLVATDVSQKQMLRKLIHDAVVIGSHDRAPAGGTLMIPRPSSKRSLIVLVTSLIAHDYAIGDRAVAAAIFVSDPESGVVTTGEVLRQLYELTPAETRVVSLLLQGKSLHQTAKELKITMNTARTHLKMIFLKTHTNRQSDLVRLLLTGPATLRVKDS